MYKRKRAGNTITRKINSTKDTAAKADKNHYISNSYLEGFIPIDTEYFTASKFVTSLELISPLPSPVPTHYPYHPAICAVSLPAPSHRLRYLTAAPSHRRASFHTKNPLSPKGCFTFSEKAGFYPV